MTPSDIIGAGLLLIGLSFLVALLGSGLLVPVGVLVLLVGIGLYLFKQYHERRLVAGQNRDSDTRSPE